MTDHLLSPIITAHCFYQCGHTESDRPDTCHDAMERHYTKQHQLDCDELVRRMGYQPRALAGHIEAGR